MQNLRLALRTLAKTPFVTIVAVASLALGIGANSAIYSSFDQLIFQSVPAVQDAAELVNLAAPGPKPGSTNCNDAGPCEVVFSYQMFRDLEKAQTPFTGLAAHSSFGTNLTFGDRTERAQGLYVSGSYFPVLKLRPALGRLLSPADDSIIGGHPVAVLSYAYWADKLGGDSSIVNKTILVRGHAMTVIGVGPKDFNGITLGQRPAVFIPLTMRGVMSPATRPQYERRNYYWVYVFARMKPGVTIERAAAAINDPYHSIINDLEAPQQQNMSAETLTRFRAKRVLVASGRTGQSNMARNAGTPLGFLFATTAIVLLIACANIANLLLARAANRSTEMAVRLSLGASRTQLVRQLLTESFVLATLGGIASIVVAKWTLALIVSMLPPQAAGTIVLTLQPAALWFTATIAVATGFAFGIFPALHSTRPDLNSVLRAGSGKIAGARTASRFRTTLATAQVALSMALLMMAGLFVKSLDKLSRADLGADMERVVTFSLAPSMSGYQASRSVQLLQQVQAELAGVPGVTQASQATVALMSNSNWNDDVSVQGFVRGLDTDANSSRNEVGPDYFRTIGATMLAGREFTESDARDAPRVAVVNEAFAKKFNLGKDVVGKYMASGRSDSLNIQIVGFVKNLKYSEVKLPAPPVYYTPIRQDTNATSASFYARSTGDPSAVLGAIPKLIARIDATLPVTELKTMPQQVKENVFVDRMIGSMSTLFAILATLLASVGLYGVLAYSVAQRTREIGVRMALGANRAKVRGMVLRQVGMMALIGAPIGVVAALGMARAAKSMLFEMQGTDPVVIVASVVTLTLVALAAGVVPAHRASRVDPMQALRYE